MGKTVKKSYGIACFRWNKHINEFQLLLIKKKYTYTFADFLYGNYNIKNEKQMLKMLNNISSYEKSLILSEDFGKMWYHIFNIDPDRQHTEASMISFYQRKKILFENKIPKSHFIKLKQMIYASNICSSCWEIPKGQTEKNEMPLNCAIREFKEETGLTSMDYNLYGCNSYSYFTTYKNKKYIREYYLAITTMMDMYPKQINYTEIEDIRWMTKQDIKKCDRSTNKDLSNFAVKLFNVIKKYKLKN